MLDYYFRNRKRLAAMKRNVLSPFLEEAADRYRAERHVHKYAQTALTYAAAFGDWLQSRRVPLNQITKVHLDGFLQSSVPRPPEKFTYRRRHALAAARLVLALIQAKYPTVCVRVQRRQRSAVMSSTCAATAALPKARWSIISATWSNS